MVEYMYGKADHPELRGDVSDAVGRAELAALAGTADWAKKAALADWSLCADDELYAAVDVVAAARAAIDAAEAHVLAELEARGATDRDFGLTTTSWLESRTRIPRPVAGARVRTATRLRTLLPDVDRALAEGRIAFDHAKTLAHLANPRVADALADVQRHLVAAAEHAPFAVWRQQVGDLVELVDQDGGHDPAADEARNRLRLDQTSGDVAVISGELVGESMLVVTQALEREADRLWRRYVDRQAEQPEAEIPTRANLRAQALVNACQGLGPDAEPGPDVSLVLHVGVPDAARLTTIENDELRFDRYEHLLCAPVLHALLMEDGVPLKLGRQVRLATPAQRRALVMRDGGCVFPGCDARPSWCDAHHVVPFGKGGSTDVETMAMLCRRHHGVTHRKGWTMVATADQRFIWTTPAGRVLHSQRHGGASDRSPPQS
jgi:hypothetical protein